MSFLAPKPAPVPAPAPAPTIDDPAVEEARRRQAAAERARRGRGATILGDPEGLAVVKPGDGKRLLGE